MSLLAYHHARRRAAVAVARPPELIWQEDDPHIEFGNGVWQSAFYAAPYGNSLKYCTTNGGAFEFVVPDGGYTTCYVEGLQDVNGSDFFVFLNKAKLLTGNSYSPVDVRAIYAQISVKEGDRIRIEFAGAGPNNGGNGGNNALYCDQIRFT
jgi:hypothetical protein